MYAGARERARLFFHVELWKYGGSVSQKWRLHGESWVGEKTTGSVTTQKCGQLYQPQVPSVASDHGIWLVSTNRTSIWNTLNALRANYKSLRNDLAKIFVVFDCTKGCRYPFAWTAATERNQQPPTVRMGATYLGIWLRNMWVRNLKLHKKSKPWCHESRRSETAQRHTVEKHWQQEVSYNGNLWDRGGYEMYHALLAAYLKKNLRVEGLL